MMLQWWVSHDWVLFALKSHGESKRWDDQSIDITLGAFLMLTVAIWSIQRTIQKTTLQRAFMSSGSVLAPGSLVAS